MPCLSPQNSPHPIIFARHSHGFTTLELLVVLALAAVLALLAVPSLSAMLTAQKASSLANMLVSSLHLARSEAIKRNARVVVCKSRDGAQCAGSGGWEQGWIVFHDANNNAQLDADEWVVQQQGGAAGGLMSLRGNTPVASYVSYSAVGAAKSPSGAFQVGTLTLCPATAGAPVPVRKIILGPTGRPRLQTGSALDCT